MLSGGTPHRRGADLTTADLTWSRVLHYGRFAERYQWTPDQVDALPEWYARLLPVYWKILDQLEAEARQRAQQQRG